MGSIGADTEFRKGKVRVLLSTKTQHFHAHARKFFFPLYEVWGSPILSAFNNCAFIWGVKIRNTSETVLRPQYAPWSSY